MGYSYNLEQCIKNFPVGGGHVVNREAGCFAVATASLVGE